MDKITEPKVDDCTCVYIFVHLVSKKNKYLKWLPGISIYENSALKWRHTCVDTANGTRGFTVRMCDICSQLLKASIYRQVC